MKLSCNNELNKNAMVEMPLMTLSGSRQIVRFTYGVINFLWRRLTKSSTDFSHTLSNQLLVTNLFLQVQVIFTIT